MRPHFCLLTGATVDASRAGSRVDFAIACCRVAPTHGSLLFSKRYLSRSSPLALLLRQGYQSFTILSTKLFWLSGCRGAIDWRPPVEPGANQWRPYIFPFEECVVPVLNC